MPEESGNPLDIQIETRLRIMAPPEQVSMPIPVQTWNDLTGRLNSCKASFRPWAVAYSVLFGVGATAGLSIAPLAIVDVAPWVVTIYAVICAAAIAPGVALVTAEKALAGQQGSQIDQLVSEMDATRESFIQSTDSD